MNIITTYDNSIAKREFFLSEAEKVARLTLPYINVRGGNAYAVTSRRDSADLAARSRPYSDAGGQSVSQFASSLKALLLPPNASWFKLSIPVEFQAQLEQMGPEATSQLDQLLSTAEEKLRSKMAEHGVYAEAEEALRRLLIEGQILCHVTADGLRVLPLRCFTVKRFNGKVRQICIKEYLETDNGNEINLYTLVDYVKGTVHQQRSDTQHAKRVAFSPKQYFVVTSMKPTLDDYAVSFANIYYGTIYAVNFLSKKIQEITHWAALNMIGIDPALQITPQEFKEKIESGDNVFSWPILPDGRTAQVGFFSAAPKAFDIQTLNFEMQRQEAILYKAFSLGISNQANSLQGRERVTAAEIIARTQELDANAQGHASTLMATFQQPLVEAYMEVLGIKIDLPNGESGIKPIILAGANLLSRMVKVNQLLTSIQTIAQLNPQFVAKLNDEALFLEVTSAQGYENAQRFLRPPEQLQPQDQPQQPSTGETEL